ncbi:MAG: AmmeMemoRadiSam system protein B [Acidimicrobiales bacterium]|nr:AmmeMemoRadiSam system protein B [Acidimicrobiales bacterium]
MGNMTPFGRRVRPPAVAGTFYPDRPDVLAATLDSELAAAEHRLHTSASPADLGEQPKAIIAPHAGYMYSGPVAASAYVRLRPFRDRITRVVLLGPAHRVAIRTAALSSADAWATPLGEVPIDQAAARRASRLPGVVFDDRAHANEHSLEVHVPFLQRVLGTDWRMLPVVVGAAPDEVVADLIEEFFDEVGNLTVVSTDLSHYHSYDEARLLDAHTVAEIAARTKDLQPEQACGAYPVRGMLAVARRHDLAVEPVDVRNSGDTAGPRDHVVGYASFVVR